MKTSPKFPADIRSPLETLRNLMDKTEMLARHIADGNPELLDGIMVEFIEQLPYGLLTDAERELDALKRRQEDQETEDFYRDQRAMHRPQRV